nr:fumarylacetoacetate hydrolase family protein [Conchiformibius kuhniae]UOP04035.1 fumarylacetoacetate hydrolase family protein [Conchiformibius kuhniae]
MMNLVLDNQSVVANTLFCVGRNYAAHAAELGNAVPAEPMIFLKPNSSLAFDGDTVRLPAFSRSVHYETELLLLVGRDADELPPENALDAVAGYGVGLDLTARDVQSAAKSAGAPWTKAKGFKGAACVSRFAALAPERAAAGLAFEMRLNGAPRQHGNSADMVFSLARLLCFLAETYGLRRGDVVFTGTPAGVGELRGGDAAEVALPEAGVSARFVFA